jgi:signal transduction histidine kinase
MDKQRHSILCVDDDQGLLGIISEFLIFEGFTVLSSSDPTEGLSTLRDTEIDILLLDIWMPKMSGIAFMKEALLEKPDLPVVIMSGSKDIQDFIMAHRNGAWEYVAKPIKDMELLAHSLNRALEKAELLRKNREYEKFLSEMVREKTALLEETNRSLKKEIEIRKASEIEMRREKERAEEASRAKSQFLAKMSHEIRTPLNAIIGMTNLCLMTGDDEERLDYLITVRESSDHLVTLINDVLDFSKIEAGKMKLSPTDIETRRFLEDVIRAMSVKAGEKSLFLSLDVDESIPGFLFADSSRLRQILINIISNALKFTHNGGVTIRVYPAAMPVSGDSDRLNIQFEIRDTGIGIAPDRFDAIFESFTQSDDSISRTYGGTGLGLSICRELVNMMKGKIWVESVLNEGSAFFFILPLRIGEENLTRLLQRETVLRDEAGKHLSILLAEDNEVNQRLACAVLGKLNHNVDVAKNGLIVLEMLKEKFYDLILMDIEMPKMDGLRATELIRKGDAGINSKNIPIIAITAHVLDEIRDQCIAVGINEYVTKPIRIEELSPIMNWVMQNS